MAGNKTSFNMSNVKSKSFSFIMDVFDFAVTFLFRIRQKFPITFVSKASLKAVSNIVLKKIKMTISAVKFIVKPTLAITIKKIKLGIVIRELGKIVQGLSIKDITLAFVSSTRQRLVSSFTIKKIKLAFVGLYGTFYSLLIYDPQTLGTLDTQTLGALDFTVIP